MPGDCVLGIDRDKNTSASGGQGPPYIRVCVNVSVCCCIIEGLGGGGGGVQKVQQ